MSYVKTRFQVGPLAGGRRAAERQPPTAAKPKGALGLCAAMALGLVVGVTASLFQSQHAPSVSDTVGRAKASVVAMAKQTLSAAGRY